MLTESEASEPAIPAIFAIQPDWNSVNSAASLLAFRRPYHAL